VLVHFTGGDDLSLFEVSQAAAEITAAAPNAEVLFGATIDPMLNGRTQVILVVTGIETESMGPRTTDLSYHRPASKPTAGPQPVVEAPAEASLAMSVEPQRAEPEIHLAEALFSQAVASSTMDHPLVVAESPNGDARANADSRSVPAVAPAQASIDMPAFLRRRRSLREYEEGK
jgi:hypothetical protein